MAGGEPAGGLSDGEGSRADAMENRSGVVDRVRPLSIRGSCRRQRDAARGPAPPGCPERTPTRELCTPQNRLPQSGLTVRVGYAPPGGGPRCRVRRVCVRTPNARCGFLDSRFGRRRRDRNARKLRGPESSGAGAAHGRVPGKASPNRPALGSSSVRLKLWRKLWRISLVNRLSAGRSGRI
jgi:hypothetical protein